jgi:hypothetical protein
MKKNERGKEDDGKMQSSRRRRRAKSRRGSKEKGRNSIVDISHLTEGRKRSRLPSVRPEW